MRALRQVFPEAEFCYVDFYDKDKLEQEVKDADVCILMGDVDPCILGENTLKWIHCDHAGLNGSARPEVFARGICDGCCRAQCPCSGRALHLFYVAELLSHKGTAGGTGCTSLGRGRFKSVARSVWQDRRHCWNGQ